MVEKGIFGGQMLDKYEENLDSVLEILKKDRKKLSEKEWVTIFEFARKTALFNLKLQEIRKYLKDEHIL